jgi:hypothetical protein
MTLAALALACLLAAAPAAAARSLAGAPAPAPSCGAAVGALCCPAGSPGGPPDRAYAAWCAGDDLICMGGPRGVLGASGVTPISPVCSAFPRSCGAVGAACCPGAYGVTTDKPLPPRCADENAWCAGAECKLNAPGCGLAGAAPCVTGGDVSTQYLCKEGAGLLKWNEMAACVACPPGTAPKNMGNTVCM